MRPGHVGLQAGGTATALPESRAQQITSMQDLIVVLQRGYARGARSARASVNQFVGAGLSPSFA